MSRARDARFVLEREDDIKGVRWVTQPLGTWMPPKAKADHNAGIGAEIGSPCELHPPPGWRRQRFRMGRQT